MIVTVPPSTLATASISLGCKSYDTNPYPTSSNGYVYQLFRFLQFDPATSDFSYDSIDDNSKASKKFYEYRKKLHNVFKVNMRPFENEEDDNDDDDTQ